MEPSSTSSGSFTTFRWTDISPVVSKINALRYPEDFQEILNVLSSTKLSSNRVSVLLEVLLQSNRFQLVVFLSKHLLETKDRFYVSSALRRPLSRMLEESLTKEVESILRVAPQPPSSYGTDPYSVFLKTFFSEIILRYISDEQAEKALGLFRHATKNDIPVSTDALNHLGILSLGQGDLKEANRIFDKLISMGKNPSASFCAHLIVACEISGDSKHYVGDSFESIALKSGVSREALDTALVEALIKFGQFDRAWTLKLDLDKRGISPNLTLLAYTRLRASRVKADDYLGAWKLLEDMAAITHSKIHETAIVEVLEMAAARGDSDFVRALSRKHEAEGNFLSKPFYSCLVTALSKSKNEKDVLNDLKVWRETTTKPDRPDLKDYVATLINLSDGVDEAAVSKSEYFDTIKQWLYEEGLLSTKEWSELGGTICPHHCVARWRF
jgi:hypothetical protein